MAPASSAPRLAHQEAVEAMLSFVYSQASHKAHSIYILALLLTSESLCRPPVETLPLKLAVPTAFLEAPMKTYRLPLQDSKPSLSLSEALPPTTRAHLPSKSLSPQAARPSSVPMA